jgi:hypothetical protein
MPFLYHTHTSTRKFNYIIPIANTLKRKLKLINKVILTMSQKIVGRNARLENSSITDGYLVNNGNKITENYCDYVYYI